MDGRLEAYTHLLGDRGVALGLIAEGDRDRVRARHVADSLRAATLIHPGEHVVDIGSGAGLPGIPLAIAVPEARFTLLEPRRKAVAFLELAVERLGLTNVEVVRGRVEDARMESDAATARAFGPVDRSWQAACRVLRPGGRLIYFAGRSFELDRAGKLDAPEPPASVEAVDSSATLVIMFRSE